MPPRLISTKHTSKVSFSSIARNSFKLPSVSAISASGSHCSNRYLSSLCRAHRQLLLFSYLMRPMFCQKLRCSKQQAVVICSSGRSSADRFSPVVRFQLRCPEYSSARPSLLHLSRSGVRRTFRIRRSVSAARSSFRFLWIHFFPRRTGSDDPVVHSRSVVDHVDPSWTVPPFYVYDDLSDSFFPLHRPRDEPRSPR